MTRQILQEGGGIVHLKKFLQFSDPRIHRFNKIIVYGGRKTLEQLSKKDWFDLREIKNLDRSILDRLIWQENFFIRMLNMKILYFLFQVDFLKVKSALDLYFAV